MNHFAPVIRPGPAPRKYGFGPHAQITISNPNPVHYKQKTRDEYVLILERLDDPSIRETFLQEEFHELWEAGKVAVDPKRFDTAWQQVRLLNPDLENGGSLSQKESQRIEFFRRLVRRLEQMHEAKEISWTDASLKKAVDRVYQEFSLAMTGGNEGENGAVTFPKRPSPGSVRRWRRRLMALKDNRLALRDRRRIKMGHRAPRIEDPLLLSILATHTHGYLSSNRPSMAHQHRLMRTDIAARNKERETEGLAELPVPSRSTLERSIRRLDRFDVMLARDGLGRLKHSMKVAGPAHLATRAGERVQIDSWRTNISLTKLPASFWEGMPEELRKKVGKSRLNLTVAICQTTKIVLGLRLSANPDGATSLRTLEMVCRDKTDIAIAAGCASRWHHALRPEAICLDNGSEFQTMVMTNAGLHLRAEIEFGVAGEPNGRPVVERFFRSTDLRLLPFFTGRTFANIVERGEYDSQAMASATIEILWKALVRWVVDVYHNEPHSGLGGETPNRAWKRCESEMGIMPPPDAGEMRAIFGHFGKARILNEGIRSLGLWYRSVDTQTLRAIVGQAEVMYRIDLQDLGFMSVRGMGKDMPWITVPCVLEEFRGISAETWIDVARDLRQRHANAAEMDEHIVLDAIRALDEMGRKAAEAAGIGPVVLTDEQIQHARETVFNGFSIVVPKSRGSAAKAMSAPEAEVPAEVEAAPAAASPTAHEAEQGPKRRRGANGSILKGD